MVLIYDISSRPGKAKEGQNFLSIAFVRRPYKDPYKALVRPSNNFSSVVSHRMGLPKRGHRGNRENKENWENKGNKENLGI